MTIDSQTLIESACDDRELACELLDMFLEQARSEMDRLTDATRQGDAGLVSLIAHKLVGSAVACGFDGLASELRSLELCSKQDMPDDISERYERLEQLLEEGRVGMTALLKVCNEEASDHR